MKLSKTLIAVAAGVAVSGVAAAQDQSAVSAEKKATIQSVLPGAYGSVEVRHRVRRKMEDKNTVSNDTPAVQLRPTLGTTLFDGKVDTSFNWIFQKNPDTMVLNKVDMFNATQWDLIQGSLGHVGPYAEIYPKTDSGYDSVVGFYGELTPSVDTAAGKVSFLAYLQPVAQIMSQNQAAANEVEPANKTGRESLSLTNDDGKIEQRDPNMYNYTGVSAKFKPAALSAMSIGLGVDYAQTWTPKYETKLVDQDERTELDGYSASSVVINKLTLGYKLTDALSLAGQLRQNIGGFYDYGITTANPDKSGNVGSDRWETRLSLNATLF